MKVRVLRLQMPQDLRRRIDANAAAARRQGSTTPNPAIASAAPGALARADAVPARSGPHRAREAGAAPRTDGTARPAHHQRAAHVAKVSATTPQLPEPPERPPDSPRGPPRLTKRGSDARTRRAPESQLRRACAPRTPGGSRQYYLRQG